MAIYVTGDTHGVFTRINMANFPEQKTMTKADYLIICGDFGCIWDGSASDRYSLDWLNGVKPFTTLFVDGNHENFDLLNAYPVSEWMGGKVHMIRDSVIHLMRGQIYEIGGKLFFTMGGAASHDISDGILETNDPLFRYKKKQLDRVRGMYRVNHVSWWAEEMPCEEEYREAAANLDAVGWKVDYVISHCLPIGVINTLNIMSGGVLDLYGADDLTRFFQDINERLDFRRWYAGHYHDDRRILDKYELLYEKILRIEHEAET
jgi:predicted phosphodiesterase